METRSLAVPATGATGTARSIADMRDSTVSVDGTGAAAFSVAVQAKVGGLWVTLATGIAASALVSVADSNGHAYAATDVRLVSTTTGAPAFTAGVSGYNENA